MPSLRSSPAPLKINDLRNGTIKPLAGLARRAVSERGGIYAPNGVRRGERDWGVFLAVNALQKRKVVSLVVPGDEIAHDCRLHENSFTGRRVCQRVEHGCKSLRPEVAESFKCESGTQQVPVIVQDWLCGS